MPDLSPQSRLFTSISYNGQEYFTSQYFHQQYIAQSPHGGKYRRHLHFVRTIRAMHLYAHYLDLGHIVEVTWDRIKAEGNPYLVSFRPLFQLNGWNPLTLLNATAQAELAHHLDDEASKQIAHAANTAITRQQVAASLRHDYHAELGKLRAYAEFAASLGLLEDRDRLMLKDMARTLLPLHVGLSSGPSPTPQLTEPVGFFLADRIRTLGYAPTRKEESSLMAKGLARDVAKEYRDRHEKQSPPQSARFVDGAVRPVFWYPEENATWIDPLIQTWCARLGLTL